MRAFLAPVCAALLAAPSPAQVANDGWVTDLADLLSKEQEQELELLMESYKQGSTNEIAVLTMPDLGGQPIERYALDVAREWGIGGAETSNGALLVVAKAERKIRIEVGRGLEGALPDVICGRIIRDVITPAFKRGDFPGGIRAGVEALHAAIGGDYAPLQRTTRGRRSSGGLVMLPVLLLLVILGSRRRRRYRGRGSIWPWLVLGGMSSGHRSSWSGGSFGGGGGGGFSGFGGGGGFSGGGASGGW